MSALFAVVTSSTEQRYYVPATQAYGAINGTAARAENDCQSSGSVATEIDQFADAFDNLGHRVSDFSARLDWWRRNLGL
jgi:hypothetical protein